MASLRKWAVAWHWVHEELAIAGSSGKVFQEVKKHIQRAIAVKKMACLKETGKVQDDK